MLFLLTTFVVALPRGASAETLAKLAEFTLPIGDDTNSGSLAFDGGAIYYAPKTTLDRSRIYRVDPASRKPYSSFVVPVPELWQMTHDGRRNRLYVLSKRGAMYDVDLGTKQTRKMFDLPAALDTWWRWSYDAGNDTFRAIPTARQTNDGNCGTFCGMEPFGIPVVTYSRTAAELHRCLIPPEATIFPTAVLAAGDGTVLIDDSDGVSLYRVSTADCTFPEKATHRGFQPEDNDSLACDTVTFEVTAVWFRDGFDNKLVAYAAPGLECPIPTRLSPVTGKNVVVGNATTVCTTLTLANPEYLLRSRPVQFTVGDGKPLGTVRTDTAGRACVKYTPKTVGRHPFRAAFGGFRGYLSSANVGAIAAQPVPKPPPKPPPAVVVDPPPQPPPPHPVAPKPVVEPKIPVETATQVQAQAQVQPQAQIQGQGVVVPQVQEQVQVSRSGIGLKDRDLAFTRFQPRRRTPVSPAGPLGAGAIAVMAMALAIGPVVRRAESRRRRP